MWPWGEGQIQTSTYAGGIASARMRASCAASHSRPPCGVTYANVLPCLRRRMPGVASLTYRSPAAAASASGLVSARPTLSLAVSSFGIRRHFLAAAARLRQTDRNSLLATRDLLTGAPGFQLPTLHLMQ